MRWRAINKSRFMFLLSGLVGFLFISFVFAISCGDSKKENDEKQKSARTDVKKKAPDKDGKEETGDDKKGPAIKPIKVPTPLPPEEEDKVAILAEDLLDFMESKFSKDTIFASRYRETFERRIRDSKHFISLMREIYTAHRHKPLFFEYTDKVPALTEEGRVLKDLLLEISTHGLNEKSYRIPQLRGSLETFDSVVEDYALARKGLSNPRARALWEMLEHYESMPSETELKAALAEMGFVNDDSVLIRDMAKFYPNLLQAKKKLNARVQEIDIVLLRGFFKFILDFKYIYRAHPFRVTPELSLSHVKFRENLREEFQRADPNFAKYLTELIPINPTYEKLRKGLVFYKGLREAGEIDKIKVKRNLKKGKGGPEVLKLTRRLALEGYLHEHQIDDVFGKTVLAGLKDYQHMHQLRESGRVDRSTRSSLNVPMSKRVRQIELSLQRWRESDISRDRLDFYVRVNIPQFELEVYENNTRVRVHRVVVGNTKEEVSLSRKQRGRFNLTPILSKKISTVVLNPFWFPPPRLQKELLEELEKEPDFFEKHNYGIRMNSDGSEVIFQKSGPGNALGQVKFLFPNEHSVYLHDTAKKALFNRPIRAYSHGCMRLDKPLDLARYFLAKINGVTKRQVKKILEKEKEHYIKLDAKIPIYIEYASVGASDDNRMYFYADIYKYDRAYWDGRLPVENTEELTNSEVKRLSGAGEDAGSGEEDDGVFPGT